MAQTKRKYEKREDENFFEALGATASRYRYRGRDKDDIEKDEDAVSEARLTAVITLVLVILVAITMGVLMIRGLQTLRDSIPADSTTGSQQL